jgi:peptidoglycan hydrolase CwlO-like protein
MINIDDVMKDVRDAWKGVPSCYIDAITDRIQLILASAFSQISSLNSAIEDYKDEIEELQEVIGEFKEEAKDRVRDDERQEIIDIFNNCSGKVV